MCAVASTHHYTKCSYTHVPYSAVARKAVLLRTTDFNFFLIDVIFGTTVIVPNSASLSHPYKCYLFHSTCPFRTFSFTHTRRRVGTVGTANEKVRVNKSSPQNHVTPTHLRHLTTRTPPRWLRFAFQHLLKLLVDAKSDERGSRGRRRPGGG